MHARFRIVAGLLLFCTAAFGWGPPKPWTELKGCRLLEHSGNDGDSFHVEHEGKEYIFRLCFVDCAETTDDYPDRTKDQAEWWGIKVEDVLQCGAKATEFTRDLLKGEFTVFTRYEDARGMSTLKRNFGMIRVGDTYLCETLVSAGLARVYGYPVVPPSGGTAKDFRAHLDKLEKRAKADRKGAWAPSNVEASVEEVDQGPGKQYTLTRRVAIYSDKPSAHFVGNLPTGTLIFVPEQPAGPMVKVRAPLHGRVISAQCRRRDLAGGVKSTKSE